MSKLRIDVLRYNELDAQTLSLISANSEGLILKTHSNKLTDLIAIFRQQKSAKVRVSYLPWFPLCVLLGLVRKEHVEYWREDEVEGSDGGGPDQVEDGGEVGEGDAEHQQHRHHPRPEQDPRRAKL